MNPAATPEQVEDVQGDNRWMSMHQRFLTLAKEREPEVVFVGDSLFQQLALTELWDKFFVPMHCLNFGIGGDQTQHILWRLQNGELENLDPKIVVVCAGTNNHGHSAEQVIGGLEAIVTTIEQKQPNAAIVVVSIPPRGEKVNPLREKITTINTGVAAFLSNHSNAQFVNIDPSMFIGQDGQINAMDMHDYLHLTRRGYQKWTEPILDEMVKKLPQKKNKGRRTQKYDDECPAVKRRQKDEDKKSKPDVSNLSPLLQQFNKYQELLDYKHDKHERLVKISRDITIESKRTIFLLHRLAGKDCNKENILEEASEKLTQLQNHKWLSLCKELKGEDEYMYLRAYSPGLQEYIEALSLQYYLKYEKLIPVRVVQQSLTFGGDEENEKIHVPPMEYMLGIADLTGELMRSAIMSIGNGNLEKPFILCQFLRYIYDEILCIGNVSRELNRKVYTLKQSLQKVENACYTVKVRGSEVPQHMLADILKLVNSAQTDHGEADMNDHM